MHVAAHAPAGAASVAIHAGARALAGSVLARLPHPGRNIPRPMEDAPDIDLRLPLDIEDQIRKLLSRPEAQVGNIQLMRKAGRAGRRLFADTAAGVLHRVDEGQGNHRSRLGQIMLDCLIDIALRPLAQDNRLAAHLRPASRTRPRSRSK